VRTIGGLAMYISNVYILPQMHKTDALPQMHKTDALPRTPNGILVA
jgi:hypothetical protein